MADLKISQLTAITTLTPATDVLPVVDSGGVTKKITTNQILGSGGTATLASATITGDLTVDTSTLKVDSANNRVGIVNASPSFALDVNGAGSGVSARISSGSGTGFRFDTTRNVGGLNRNYLIGCDVLNEGWFSIVPSTALGGGTFTNSIYNASYDGTHTWNDGAGGERMRLNATGLGVGVTPSAGKGALQLSSGINFPATQVASADANTLDDYEEGTWTIGLTFGGGSTGLTTALNTGRYTKIGRQVTVSGRLELSNKGSSTGAAVITGLPFSIANTNEASQAASFRCNGVSYTGAFQGYGLAGSTTIPLEQISEAGSLTDLTNSNFVNGTSIQISLTYTV